MLSKLEKIIDCLYTSIRYGRCIKVRKTIIRRCHFRIQKNRNQICLSNIRIFNSKFILEGTDNNVVIKKSPNIVYALSAKIYGKGNKLIIEDNACIYGLRIVIRGENCHVVIGKDFTENINCMITCMGRNNFIRIGDDCMLSENIDIWNTDSHHIINENGNVINKNKPIIIGNHVWIGKNCSILKGVIVGDNSIIGMSSVVTKNVDKNSIYVGNPAKKVKEGINWTRDYLII